MNKKKKRIVSSILSVGLVFGLSKAHANQDIYSKQLKETPIAVNDSSTLKKKAESLFIKNNFKK